MAWPLPSDLHQIKWILEALGSAGGTESELRRSNYRFFCHNTCSLLRNFFDIIYLATSNTPPVCVVHHDVEKQRLTLGLLVSIDNLPLRTGAESTGTPFTSHEQARTLRPIRTDTVFVFERVRVCFSLSLS